MIEPSQIIPMRYTPGDAGIVSVAKPAHCTSHDIVAQIRRIYNTKKVGHAGTLDPAATGVLVIGIGRATKFLGYLSLTEKTYTTTIRLGYGTLTDDAYGEVLHQYSRQEIAAISDDMIFEARSKFIGTIMQKPSQVSAIKVKGERAYATVRSGQNVDLAAREVTIFQFDIISITHCDEWIDCEAIVICSSGTYIRALARDLGQALGIAGHVHALHRNRVGIFTQPHEIDELKESPILDLSLERAAYLMYPHREITEEQQRDLRYGKKIPAYGLSGIYAGITPDNKVIALLSETGDHAKSEFFIDP